MQRPLMSREEWAARVAAMGEERGGPRARRAPLTAERIVEVSLQIVEAERYEALTMRRVAAALQTGPASLYVHVRNKAELDDLLIGAICTQVNVPTPDAAQWQAQFVDVCRQMRDQFLRYPGIAQAALGAAPHSLDALRISEGMFSIVLAGGIAPQPAAWMVDGAFLYVEAYSLEHSLREQGETDLEQLALDRAEVIARFQMLPPQVFPNTVAHADALTSGNGHERFDFTLELMLRGLGTGSR